MHNLSENHAFLCDEPLVIMNDPRDCHALRGGPPVHLEHRS